MLPVLCAAQTRILVLGDSIAAGFGVETQQAFPAIVESQLRGEGYRVKIFNGGISGSTSASAVGRLKWFARAKPDILILELGANDGLRGQSTQALKSNLIAAVKMARERGMEVVLAGMKMPLNYGKEYTLAFESVYREVAAELQLHFIPFLLQGVALRAELNQADGIHPNVEGHKVIARRVASYLQPLLSKDHEPR